MLTLQKLHIGGIFCLQEPGEHPYCGDGIHTGSGLSYLPEEFYERRPVFSRRHQFLQLWVGGPPDNKFQRTDQSLEIPGPVSAGWQESRSPLPCRTGSNRVGDCLLLDFRDESNCCPSDRTLQTKKERRRSLQPFPEKYCCKFRKV